MGRDIADRTPIRRYPVIHILIANLHPTQSWPLVMNHPRRMKLRFEARGEVLEAIAAAPENDRRQIVRQAVATANSASRIGVPVAFRVGNNVREFQPGN